MKRIWPKYLTFGFLYFQMFTDMYDVQAIEETDIIYKKQKNLNLTLQYNEW